MKPPFRRLPLRVGRTRARLCALLSVAFVANALFFRAPFFRFLGAMLTTAMHEAGHAVVAWAFAYPALPTFDILGGGGITFFGYDRPLLLAWIPPGVFLCLSLFCLSRRERRAKWFVGMGVAWLVYAFFFFSFGAFLALMDLSGHFGEIVAGCLFCLLGASPRWKRPEWEHFFVFSVGTHILCRVVVFSLSLVRSDAFVRAYAHAEKVNDFVKLSGRTGLPLSFFAILLLLLVCAGVCGVVLRLASEGVFHSSDQVP